MGEEINGVKSSIIPFLDSIADSDIDVKSAGYAYADWTVEYRGLTSEYNSGSDFYS